MMGDGEVADENQLMEELRRLEGSARSYQQEVSTSKQELRQAGKVI